MRQSVDGPSVNPGALPPGLSAFESIFTECEPIGEPFLLGLGVMAFYPKWSAREGLDDCTEAVVLPQGASLPSQCTGVGTWIGAAMHIAGATWNGSV